MEFGFSEQQNILRDSVRKLMDKHAPPEYVRRLDREQAYPDELYAAWVDAGLLRLPFPEDYGGLGGNVLDMVIVAEELARKSADVSKGPTVMICTPTWMAGTEAGHDDWKNSCPLRSDALCHVGGGARIWLPEARLGAREKQEGLGE